MMKKQQSGFTLIELMIVVAIIGILAAIAIPLFHTYQLRSKSAEGKTNLGAIRVLDHSYFSVHDEFLEAVRAPAVIPGTSATVFTPNADFGLLGFHPEGRVFFSYGVAVSADGVGYTADAERECAAFHKKSGRIIKLITVQEIFVDEALLANRALESHTGDAVIGAQGVEFLVVIPFQGVLKLLSPDLHC